MVLTRFAHIAVLGLWLTLGSQLTGAAVPVGENFERILATSEVLADAVQRLGGEGPALATRVRAVLSDARRAAAEGRTEEAQVLAARAYGDLREAVRSSLSERVTDAVEPPAAPPRVVDAGYLRKRESAIEMRKAAQRIAAEKGRALTRLQSFDAQLALADQSAGAGQIEDAAHALAQAYEMIKGELIALRNGDTLVRSLSFDTPEQEYRYELDRNDTFSMLVGLLGGESASDERTLSFERQARALRIGAEQAALRVDFAEGIRLLEESTREYQKLMRNAGILIPG